MIGGGVSGGREGVGDGESGGGGGQEEGGREGEEGGLGGGKGGEEEEEMLFYNGPELCVRPLSILFKTQALSFDKDSL